MRPPSLVLHCDWSTSAAKRWLAAATLEDGRYRLAAPAPVGPVGARLAELQADRAGPVLIGFDFPIGLPARYGANTGLDDFRACLEAFGTGAWAQWFDVVDDRREISIRRPFYPSKPGGRSQQHLFEALGCASIAELRRVCERATASRNAACPLFWTLGGNQVGKAAISGWREFVVPALRQPGTGLWPFDGTIAELLGRSRLVIAETYPADAYGQIGFRFRGGMSKRRQSDRSTFAAILREWAERRGHVVEAPLAALIDDGFGARANGEDMFDAFAGLCGMLDVVGGHRGEGTPASPEITRWEGWILGQQATPIAS